MRPGRAARALAAALMACGLLMSMDVGPASASAKVKNRRGPAATWSLPVALVILVVGCGEQPTTPSASESLGPPVTTPPAETASTAPELSCDPDAAPQRPDDGEVLVFFTCGTSPLATVAAVTRPTDADAAEDQLSSAIAALLAGPTATEQESGLRSWFSAATEGRINSVVINDAGVAVVDFEDFSDVIPNASTTAGRRQLLAEIRATVFQFDHIETAELQFNGSCDAFWAWLEATCMPLVPEAR